MDILNKWVLNSDEIYSGIAIGRVLAVRLYTHINVKLIFLNLFTDLFIVNVKIIIMFPFSSE